MEIVFLWSGLLFAALGVIMIRSARADEAAGHMCDGEVIGYAKRLSVKSSTAFAPVVVFRNRFSARFAIESPLASGNLPYSIGQRVRVLVTAGDPPRGRIAGSGIVWFGATLVAIGVFLTIVFFSIFRWTFFSVLIATAVSVALVVHYERNKAKFAGIVNLLKSIRQATTGMAVPEAQFDRSSLASRIELDAIRRSQPKQALVAAIVLLLLAAGGITWSVLWNERRSAFLKHAVAAEGLVVDMVANHDSDGTTWAPVVEFTPANGWGAPVRFKHWVSTTHPSWSVGDRVRVLHDPADPKNAMIDSGLWNRIGPLIPGGIAALLVLLGIASLRSAFRRVL